VISGAWAIPLFRSNRNFGDIRRDAALLQKTETEHLEILRKQDTKARVRIWTLADFAAAPMEPLQAILDEIAPTRRRLTEVPRMVDLGGFPQFLQNLRNQGMQPTLMGDFAAQIDNVPHDAAPVAPAKPYLVR
jgi:hypothetical protein